MYYKLACIIQILIAAEIKWHSKAFLQIASHVVLPCKITITIKSKMLIAIICAVSLRTSCKNNQFVQECICTVVAVSCLYLRCSMWLNSLLLCVLIYYKIRIQLNGMRFCELFVNHFLLLLQMQVLIPFKWHRKVCSERISCFSRICRFIIKTLHYDLN